MGLVKRDENPRVPYQRPMPKEAQPEIVVPDAIPADERLWVPQAENVWFRPLGFVLKGRWYYLEHDWVAEEGGYVYEPPGETHTLVVPDDVEEMITYFQVNGVMYYVDPQGNHLGYEDVFTKIDLCRRHYAEVGIGADYVDRLIR